MRVDAAIKNNTQKTAPDYTLNDTKASQKAPEVDIPDNMLEDIIEISEEAKLGAEELLKKEFLKADNDRKAGDDLQKKLEEMRGRYQELREGLKNAQKAGEGMAEVMKEKIRCLQIAMRIMSGGKVPEEDRRYLAEKDIELYNQAISLRIEKKDPKEYDSLLEDEEDKAESDDSTDVPENNSAGSAQDASDAQADPQVTTPAPDAVMI